MDYTFQFIILVCFSIPALYRAAQQTEAKAAVEAGRRRMMQTRPASSTPTRASTPPEVGFEIKFYNHVKNVSCERRSGKESLRSCSSSTYEPRTGECSATAEDWPTSCYGSMTLRSAGSPYPEQRSASYS